jgi:hypothetical protein
MQSRIVALALFALVVVTACGTRSSAVPSGSIEPPWEGPVFVSQQPLPAGIKHKVVGSVQADARAGYDSALSLYPLLAAQAKKIGANAVVNTTGSRRMTAFSWSAPYVMGTAVRVEDPEQLKGLSGTFH